MHSRSSLLYTPPLLAVIAAFTLTVLSSFAREPSPAEEFARDEAQRSEVLGDWLGAGSQWEKAMLAADAAGESDRAIAHGERAVAAWSKSPAPMGREGLCLALGVLSKLEMARGRLTAARERNVGAMRVIEERIAQASGWNPVAGEAPPPSAPANLLELWARALNDTAHWLDLQGRSIEAMNLVSAADRSMRAASPDGEPHGFYHRKLIGTRAEIGKFLGFHQQAIDDLRALDRVPPAAGLEHARRFNLLYYSSQVFGPEPEYLDGVRALLREETAAKRNTRAMRRLIARMAFAYQEEGADVSDLEDVIAEARAAGVELEAVYSERDRAVLSMSRGEMEGVERALLDSLASVRRLGIKRGEPTLYREYGVFLAKAGRHSESLAMLQEALRLTRAFGWTQHLPGLLHILADTQRAIGDAPGLARTLAELDALIAGEKLAPQREFRALCARAFVLLALGQDAAAQAAIARATASAENSGLNEFQRRDLAWTKDVTPAPGAGDAAPAGIVDLQPIAVLAPARAGEFARARFRVSNATNQTAIGVVRIQGPHIAASFDAVSGAVNVTTSESETGRTSIPAQIPPGEDLLIQIEAAVGETDGAIRIAWESGERTARAVCHLRRERGDGKATAAESTVSDTSLARNNPFYAVHLYHPVAAAGGGLNFRILPSRPCRVEIIDARDAALLAVDADGDGAFRSAGDNAGIDADRDGFPELPAATAGDSPAAIEVLIFPLAGAPAATTDTRIEIQTRTAAGIWMTTAHDILKRK